MNKINHVLFTLKRITSNITFSGAHKQVYFLIPQNIKVLLAP